MELTIAGALVTDDGRGIARIDSKARKMLNVISGDAIEIKGKWKSTVAIAWQAHQQDEGLDFIRVDGWIRQNIGAEIGNRVHVSKADVKMAEKVILAPSPNQRNPMSPDFAQYAKMKLENKPLVKGDVVPVAMVGYAFNFTVVQVVPQGKVVRITKETDVVVRNEPVAESMGRTSGVTYENIGGLESIKNSLKDRIEIPLQKPEKFHILGIKIPKGILLYGPSGTGKTMLLNAFSNQAGVNIIEIMLPGLISKFFGESEEKLRILFEKARNGAPSIVLIDNLEVLSELDSNDVLNRIVIQLARLMDEENETVITLAATNNIKGINRALLSRFDIIEVPLPNPEMRSEIFKVHMKLMPIATDVILKELIELTQDYTGADILKTCRDAGINCLRECRAIVIRKDFINAIENINKDSHLKTENKRKK